MNEPPARPAINLTRPFCGVVLCCVCPPSFPPPSPSSSVAHFGGKNSSGFRDKAQSSERKKEGADYSSSSLSLSLSFPRVMPGCVCCTRLACPKRFFIVGSQKKMPPSPLQKGTQVEFYIPIKFPAEHVSLMPRLPENAKIKIL